MYVLCSLGLKKCPFDISKHAIECSYSLLLSFRFEIRDAPFRVKNRSSSIKNNAPMLFLLAR